MLFVTKNEDTFLLTLFEYFFLHLRKKFFKIFAVTPYDTVQFLFVNYPYIYIYIYICVCVCIYIIYIYIYIYIRGGTVHRYHGSVRTSLRGSRFDTISVKQKKKSEIYYAQFLFIYFEQTVVQITILSIEM